MLRYHFGAILMIALTTAAVIEADSPPAGQDARIGTLIKQLASDRFSAREKAGHKLEAIGAAALPALRQATKSPDLETSRRATEIIRKVDERLSAAKMLAPKQVRLRFKDTVVLDAVKQLEKESGYKIQLQGSPVAGTITLDTGATTFWQVLDQLCTRAALREPAQTVPMPGQPWGAHRQPVPLPFPPPAPGNVGSMSMPMANAGPITLRPDETPLPPTCYAGSVRIRLVAQRFGSGEIRLSFDVAAEPRLQSFSLDGNPRLDTPLDDQAQKLELLADDNPPQPGAVANVHRLAAMGFANPMMMAVMGVRQATVRLKPGHQKAKWLKEISGSLTAKAFSETEPLITVDNVLSAAGKTVKGAHGGSIQVQSIDKMDNGDYQAKILVTASGPLAGPLAGLPGPMMIPGGGVAAMQFQQVQMQRMIQVQVQMQRVMQMKMGGNVRFAGAFPMADRMPTLVSKDGKAYRVVNMPGMRMTFANGQMSQEATLVFHPNDGQGPPDRLVYSGQRIVSFTVPFRFKDVPF